MALSFILILRHRVKDNGTNGKHNVGDQSVSKLFTRAVTTYVSVNELLRAITHFETISLGS